MSDREITVTDIEAGSALRTAERVRNRFMNEYNRTSADAGPQGANFACTIDKKTRRGTIAPSLEQRREQSSGRTHSEFAVSNPDAVQAVNTFDLTCTRREHERDIDQPRRHV
ncbi:MAG: hypothetical protein EZS28_020440 [Streblomastix strix]|uniref:Uncharacterized protein n=1 Tax=Streblomastix strix TaxID=222440 RepID=A0A5J4VN77_9EUKA|nr:MAG: hypothetical protein EZS28_020440 [Streblomastix strix]